MTQYQKVHISQIRPGDTVFHEGHERTVSKSNIKRSPFMGVSLFGDTYNLGYKKVTKILFVKS
jgi:hypothetical protein